MVWNKLPMPGTLKLTTTSLKMASLEAKGSLHSMWRAKVILKSLLFLYIDDLIFTRNDEKMVEKLRKEMMKKYGMDDIGLFRYFLGIKVYQEEDGVFVC